MFAFRGMGPMKHRPTVLICCLALGIGLLIGAAVNSLSLTQRLQAHALSWNETERLYRELESDDNPLVQGGRLLAKIAYLTTPSVVHIEGERVSQKRGLVQETGSGVIVKNSKSSGSYIVTNRHVLRDINELDNITIRLHDGRVLHPVRKWEDVLTDVAVMQIEADEVAPARWGDSDKVDIGHFVLAMGSPFGLSESVTFGIVSAKSRRSLSLGRQASVLNQDFLQTDAPINPGNSGGPLIDMHGRVVGINTAIASSSGGNDGIGFSIPSNLVRRIVEDLLEHGRVRRAYLGVTLDSEFDSRKARRLGLDRPRGARVVRVYSDTPADRANLKYDDVILSIEGIPIQDENHLINLVSLESVGKEVSLVVWRDGRETVVRLELSDRDRIGQ